MSRPIESPFLDNLLELASDIKTLEAAHAYEKARVKEVFGILDTELENAPDVESVYISQSTPMGDDAGDWVPAIKRKYVTEKGEVELLVGRFFHVPTQGHFRSNRHITFAMSVPERPGKTLFTVTEDNFTGSKEHTDIDTTEELVSVFIGLGKSVELFPSY